MDADHIDPERRRLREGAAQKPPAEMTAEEKREMRALRTAQRAFQKQYCPSCAHYRCGVGGGRIQGERPPERCRRLFAALDRYCRRVLELPQASRAVVCGHGGILREADGGALQRASCRRALRCVGHESCQSSLIEHRVHNALCASVLDSIF